MGVNSDCLLQRPEVHASTCTEVHGSVSRNRHSNLMTNILIGMLIGLIFTRANYTFLSKPFNEAIVHLYS